MGRVGSTQVIVVTLAPNGTVSLQPRSRQSLHLLDKLPYVNKQRKTWWTYLPDLARDIPRSLLSFDRGLPVVLKALRAKIDAREKGPDAEVLRWFNPEARPYGYQVRGIHAGLSSRRIVLADDTGLGKALAHGTKVLTPRGWKNIEDFAKGDMVIGSDGRPTPVTGVYPQGQRDLFRVTFSDGNSVVVDGDHLWSVRTKVHKYRGQGYQTHRTRDLMESVHRDWQTPQVASAIEFAEGSSLPLDPYLVGVLLGDGHLTDRSRVVFTPGDELVPREVEKVIPVGLRLVGVGRSDATKRWGISGQPGAKNPVMAEMEKLGLMGLYSWERFIPEPYLWSSPTERLALLQGLMDTDGEARPDGHLSFSSSSKMLADGVAWLVESLGGAARQRVRKEPKYVHNGKTLVGRPSYQVTIALPDEVNPLRAFAHRYRGRPKYEPVRVIRSIEPCGSGLATCISVGAADHLYVIEHGIVTHNSPQAIGIMVGAFARGLISRAMIICPASLKDQWYEEINKFVAPEFMPRKIVKLTPGDPDLRRLIYQSRWDVLILNPELILRDFKHVEKIIASIGLAVLDEASLIRNTESDISIAMRKLFVKTPMRIALTATPVENRLLDLYSVFSWVDRRVFLSFRYFCSRYVVWKTIKFKVKTKKGKKAKVTKRVPTRYRNLGEVKGKIRGCYIRRRAADVGVEMPGLVVKWDVLQMPPRQREVYEGLRGEARASMVGLKGAAIFGPLIGLRQACLSTALVMERGVETKPGQVKVDRLRELLSTDLAGEQVVIFTEFAKFANILRKALSAFRPALFTGELGQSDRRSQMAAFLGGTRQILITTSAGERGHNLQVAGVLINADLPWNPAALKQRVGRIFRLKSRHKVIRIINLTCADTIEETLIRPRLYSKRQLFERLFRGDDLSEADPIGGLSSAAAAKLV